MTEQYPSDAELNAMSGTSDAEQEVLYIPAGLSPYHTSFYKMQHRLMNVARRAGDLRVFKDGDMTFGVRAGKFMDGVTAQNFAGAAGQPLVNNQANYIYITAAGTLIVNQSGFPQADLTPHIPLAVITTAAGAYSVADIQDYRGRAMFRVLQGSACRWRGLSAAAPSSPLAGDIYKNSGSSQLLMYDGLTWMQIG